MKISAISEKGNLWKENNLLNSLIVHDHVYIPPDDSQSLVEIDLYKSRYSMNDYEMLKKSNFIKHSGPFDEKINDQALALLKAYGVSISDDLRDDEKSTKDYYGFFNEWLRSKELTDENNIVSPISNIAKFRRLYEFNTGRENVTRLIFKKFPIFSKDTPLDEVLEYRNNNELGFIRFSKFLWELESNQNIHEKEITEAILTKYHEFTNHEDNKNIDLIYGSISLTVNSFSNVLKGIKGISNIVSDVKNFHINIKSHNSTLREHPMYFFANARKKYE